ncbi:MAG: CehA/McbA family metallohydrolase [Thermodesulfobacteriota bacterium]
MNFSGQGKFTSYFKTGIISLFLLVLVLPITSFAGVSVEKGPTPVQSGDALTDSDITMKNDKIVISIAAGTPAPWGVAKGGILDGAVVKNGKAGVDRITLVDFIPNNWSSWPTTYQKINIVENSEEKGVVETKRDWGKCDLVTTYTLEKGSDRVDIVTTIKNNGDKPTGDILSGYALWATGGYHFGPPGIYETKKTSAEDALSDWSVTYDEDWMLALHAPYFDYINYHGKDMYLQNNLKPGEEKEYTGSLQITPKGDLAPVLNAEIKRKNLKSGTVFGKVETLNGEKVADPYIVVKKDGKPYTWAAGKNGEFELNLPVGEYFVYATAAGYSSGAEKKIKVENKNQLNINFSKLKSPGILSLDIRDKKNNPADARISIEKGQTPLIRFLGKKTFFTMLDKRGKADITLAPGEYEFAVESGANFFSEPVVLEADIKAGKTAEKNIVIDKLLSAEKGWSQSDLHHHSDQLDGKTPPVYLLRSQLAADVDFAFISDHDTIVNNKYFAELAKEAGIKIIPSVEISPSWGHFNVYPLAKDETWDLDSGTATVQEIFQYARKKGAKIIQQNHPLIPYGYYENIVNETITGDYKAGFDLVELNSDAEYKDAWKLAMSYWNQGDRYYISAGTDVHDVWSRKSGEIRMFAYTPDSQGVDSFVNALKNGQSYASFGPMIVPENFMFGDEIKLADNESSELEFVLKSVNGIKNAVIVQGGKEIRKFNFDDTPLVQRVTFEVDADKDTWVAIVVEDSKGKKAYSNPVWINKTKNPQMSEK